MTHRASTALFAIAFSWLLMGCSATFVPFTHELRARHDLSDGDMQQLQYYVSHEVKLRREAQTTGRDISGGNLKILEGKTIQEVVIHQHTPGVATAIDGNAITISFSEGSELKFSLRTGEAMPLRKTSGSFAEPPEAFPRRPRRSHEHQPAARRAAGQLLARLRQRRDDPLPGSSVERHGGIRSALTW